MHTSVADTADARLAANPISLLTEPHSRSTGNMPFLSAIRCWGRFGVSVITTSGPRAVQPDKALSYGA